jgi:hypothetical protein
MSHSGSDDKSISDGAGLLRRVHPSWVVEDKNIGQRRASSAAFKDPEMSVDIEPVLLDLGLDWNRSLRDFPQHSLVRLMAAAARAEAQAIIRAPTDENPAHGEVHGKKTPGIANRLLASSEVVLLK